MTYEQRLLAAGIPQDTAQRDAWADCVQWLNNREAERYARDAMQDAQDFTPVDFADRRG